MKTNDVADLVVASVNQHYVSANGHILVMRRWRRQMAHEIARRGMGHLHHSLVECPARLKSGFLALALQRLDTEFLYGIGGTAFVPERMLIM